MSEPAAVETEGLEKRYPATRKSANETVALGGVSLRIEPGEIFALLGPNGAGKTTWISIVCGLVRATGGQARVFGHDVVRESLTARRLIGLVPQEVNFDPFFTPREVLRFQQGYYGQRADEARIDEVLAALNLADKANATTRELSGGMRRRLLIGKALVHRPRVAFLDEPTAGVDVALRRDLWSYVRQLREKGTTIVLTTHYLEEAEALADRVAVIDRGRLVTLDRPQDLMRRHGHKQLHATLTTPLPLDVSLPTPLASARIADDRLALECAMPTAPAEVAALLAAVAALPLADVRTEQPSLEQVFLALTDKGRS